MIKHEDLEKFRGQYPYGSELFGVYQTLLGWRSARARNWFAKGYAVDRLRLSDAMFSRVRADVEARPNTDQVIEGIGRIGIGIANDDPKYPSKLIEALAEDIPEGRHLDEPQFWKDKLTDDRLMATLNRNVREEARHARRAAGHPPPHPHAQRLHELSWP